MAEFPTFKGSWPWPWIKSYCIPSCVTHRPLPTHQISLKSKKTFLWTDGRTFETHFIRSTRRSWPKNIIKPVLKGDETSKSNKSVSQKIYALLPGQNLENWLFEKHIRQTCYTTVDIHQVLTNDIHLHFVLIHCINSYTRALNWTKAYASCCSAVTENVGPTNSTLPSLSKHCRLTRSTICLVSCGNICVTEAKWKLQTAHWLS